MRKLVADDLDTAENLRVVRAFTKIKSRAVRKEALRLLEMLATSKKKRAPVAAPRM